MMLDDRHNIEMHYKYWWTSSYATFSAFSQASIEDRLGHYDFASLHLYYDRPKTKNIFE